MSDSSAAPLDPTPPVLAYRDECRDGWSSDWHSHSRGMFVWFPGGVVSTPAPNGVWVTPDSGAIWVPPGHVHRTTLHGGGTTITLYVDAVHRDALPRESCVVPMSQALRASVSGMMSALDAGQSPQVWLQTFLSEMVAAALPAVENPYPRGSERCLISKLTAEQPALARRSLEEWAFELKVTPGVASEQLKRATGLSFRKWQGLARLLRAVELLALGQRVSDTARAVGYESLSQFSQTFRQRLGTAPGLYFEALRGADQAPARGAAVPRSEGAPVAGAQAASRASAVLESVIGDQPDGNYSAIHQHDCGELLWMTRGVMSIGTPDGTWTADSSLGVWIPTGVEHDALVWGSANMQCVFVHASVARRLPARCCAVRVSDRLRRALLDLAPSPDGTPEGADRAFIDEVKDSALPGLPLGLLRARRLEPLVRAWRVDPALNLSSSWWAAHLGMSERTLARTFELELGLSFRQLRQLMQARRAVESLALGESVAAVSVRVGFQSTSKFVAMFRRLVGVPPARYLMALAPNADARGTSRSGRKPI